MSDHDSWIDQLLYLPRNYKRGSKSVLQLLDETGLPHPLPTDLAQLVAHRLRRSPELVDDWQLYSYDKRAGGPQPYLKEREVGIYDDDFRDVVHYDDAVDACADFVVRETEQLLQVARLASADDADRTRQCLHPAGNSGGPTAPHR